MKNENSLHTDQSDRLFSPHQRFPNWINSFYHSGNLQTRTILEVTMENRTILTEQIERLLALADEKQLRLLYIAALQLV